MRLPWKTKSRLLQDEVDFLRAQVAQLQNYLIMVAPGSLASPAVPSQEPTYTEAHRLYSTEYEEDLEFQLQEGLISGEEYARKLEQYFEESND